VAVGDISAVVTDAIVFSVLGMLVGRALGTVTRARGLARTVPAQPALVA
jgi:hypothetical protein